MSHGPRARRITLVLALLLGVTTHLAAQAELSIDDVTLLEGDAGLVDAIFTVTLVNGPGGTVTVDFQTADGSATEADADYLGAGGGLTFTGVPNPETRSVTVQVVGDTSFEADEFFLVNLSNAVGAMILDGQGLGTIQNDDALTLSIGDATVTEGDAGTIDAAFTVTLSGEPQQSDVTVDFASSNGTATVGDNDYVATSGSLLFPAPAFRRGGALGPVTQVVTVTVNGDTQVESDETFFLNLMNAVGAPIIDGQGDGLILNDDSPTLAIDDVAVAEGDSGGRDAVFRVTLSSASQQTVTVDATTRGGTATDGDDDYVSASGRLTFAPGVTTRDFAVEVRGDTRPEADESFFVDLTNPFGGGIADGVGQGTISDDDEAPGEIRLVEVPSAAEAGGTATVTLERTGGAGAAQVTIAAVGGTALEGEDFVASFQVVEWAGGETGIRSFDVLILDDNLEEGDETVRIRLSDPVGADLGEPAQLDLVIVDDDMPMELEIVGDDETLSIVNGEVGLEVRVSRTDGTPVQGATVLWSLEGDGELIDGEATLSDAEGIATNQVRLGSSPGQVLITAQLADGDGSTTFEITVEGNLSSLFDRAGNPAEASVAGVLDASCARAVGAFGEACDYIFGLDDPADRRQVVRELTPREAAAQGTFSLDSMRIQQHNIGRRLSALRGGGADDTAEAADQLTFQSGDFGISVAQLRTLHRAPEEDVWMKRFEGAWWEDTAVAETEDPPAIDQVSPWGLFVNGSVSMGQRDETADEEGFDFDSTGLTLGVDYRLSDRTVIGGAIGLVRTQVDLDRSGGGFDADGFSLSGYALRSTESFYATAVVTLGQLDLDLVRNIDLPAPFQGQDRFVLAAATDAEQFSIALEAGYDKPFGASVLSTFARLSSIDATIDDYAENGTGPFALVILGQDIESLLAEGGIDWSHAASRSWGIAQTVLRLSYLHEFEDSSRLIRGRFVEDIEANEFAVPTDAPDRDFFNLGAGITATLPRGRSLFVFIDSDLARSDLDRYTLSFGLRWEL